MLVLEGRLRVGKAAGLAGAALLGLLGELALEPEPADIAELVAHRGLAPLLRPDPVAAQELGREADGKHRDRLAVPVRAAEDARLFRSLGDQQEALGLGQPAQVLLRLALDQCLAVVFRGEARGHVRPPRAGVAGVGTLGPGPLRLGQHPVDERIVAPLLDPADRARDGRGMRPRRLGQGPDRLAMPGMCQIERRIARRARTAPFPEDRSRDVRAPVQNVMSVRHVGTPLL